MDNTLCGPRKRTQNLEVIWRLVSNGLHSSQVYIACMAGIQEPDAFGAFDGGCSHILLTIGGTRT